MIPTTRENNAKISTCFALLDPFGLRIVPLYDQGKNHGMDYGDALNGEASSCFFFFIFFCVGMIWNKKKKKSENEKTDGWVMAYQDSKKKERGEEERATTQANGAFMVGKGDGKG